MRIIIKSSHEVEWNWAGIPRTAAFESLSDSCCCLSLSLSLLTWLKMTCQMMSSIQPGEGAQGSLKVAYRSPWAPKLLSLTQCCPWQHERTSCLSLLVLTPLFCILWSSWGPSSPSPHTPGVTFPSIIPPVFHLSTPFKKLTSYLYNGELCISVS